MQKRLGNVLGQGLSECRNHEAAEHSCRQCPQVRGARRRYARALALGASPSSAKRDAGLQLEQAV